MDDFNNNICPEEYEYWDHPSTIEDIRNYRQQLEQLPDPPKKTQNNNDSSQIETELQKEEKKYAEDKRAYWESIMISEKSALFPVAEMIANANQPKVTQDDFNKAYDKVIQESPEFYPYNVTSQNATLEKAAQEFFEELTNIPNTPVSQIPESKWVDGFTGINDYISTVTSNKEISDDYLPEKIKEAQQHANELAETEQNARMNALNHAPFAAVPNSHLPTSKDFLDQYALEKQYATSKSNIENILISRIPAKLRYDENVKRIELTRLLKEQEKEYKKYLFELAKHTVKEKDPEKRLEMVRCVNISMNIMEETLVDDRHIIQEESVLLPKIKDKEVQKQIINKNNGRLLKNAILAQRLIDFIHEVPHKLPLIIIQNAGAQHRDTLRYYIMLTQNNIKALEKKKADIQSFMTEKQSESKNLMKSIFSKKMFDTPAEINSLQKQIKRLDKIIAKKTDILLIKYAKLNMTYEKAINRSNKELEDAKRKSANYTNRSEK